MVSTSFLQRYIIFAEVMYNFYKNQFSHRICITCVQTKYFKKVGKPNFAQNNCFRA